MNRFVAFLCVGLATISTGHAENRLFPTDILSPGEMDCIASISRDTHSANLNFKGNAGKTSLDLTKQTGQVRYGLGSNWHIGASLDYRSQAVVRTDYRNPAAHYVDTGSEGWQNPSLWVKYGFIHDSTSPVSLSGALRVTPNATGNSSTYQGDLTLGWRNSDTLRLYGAFSAMAAAASNQADTVGISVGLHKDISDNVTLAPRAAYFRHGGTSSFSALTQYGVGLSVQVRVDRNTYLLPNMALYRNSSAISQGGLHEDATRNGKAVRLSLYHLF
ncbi:MAG: hypothetical protein KGZ83_20955 [Sulfuricella sp.]|nr:hypothetical protein [Sulfuricella sp.]